MKVFNSTSDNIFGYDIATLFINKNSFHGYLSKSPIEPKIISKYNYIPAKDESKKPFRAHWMISESKLFLGYVNGIINGVRFYTREIVPEFPNNDILYFYDAFSGELNFEVMEIENKVNYSLIEIFDNLLLTFDKGILIKTIKK